MPDFDDLDQILGADVPAFDVKGAVSQAAKKYGVDEDLAQSVARQESGASTGLVSIKGARGPMQLMPDTAKGLGVDIDDPGQNVDGGVRLLKQLMDRYQGDRSKALAAYNAGPTRVDSGKPLPQETQDYVKALVPGGDTELDRMLGDVPKQQAAPAPAGGGLDDLLGDLPKAAPPLPPPSTNGAPNPQDFGVTPPPNWQPGGELLEEPAEIINAGQSVTYKTVADEEKAAAYNRALDAWRQKNGLGDDGELNNPPPPAPPLPAGLGPGVMARSRTGQLYLQPTGTGDTVADAMAKIKGLLGASPVPQIPVQKGDSSVFVPVPFGGIPIPVPAAMVKGFINTVGGQVNLGNAALAIGTGGLGALGRAGQALQTAIGAAATGTGLYGAADNAKQAYQAYQNGDLDSAAAHLGMGTAKGLFAALIGRATYRNMPGVAADVAAARDAYNAVNPEPAANPGTPGPGTPEGPAGTPSQPPAAPKGPTAPDIRTASADQLQSAWEAWLNGPGKGIPRNTPWASPGELDTAWDWFNKQEGGVGNGEAPQGEGPQSPKVPPAPARPETTQTHQFVDPKTGKVTLVQTEAGGPTPEQATGLLDQILDHHDDALERLVDMFERGSESGAPGQEGAGAPPEQPLTLTADVSRAINGGRLPDWWRPEGTEPGETPEPTQPLSAQVARTIAARLDFDPNSPSVIADIQAVHRADPTAFPGAYADLFRPPQPPKPVTTDPLLQAILGQENAPVVETEAAPSALVSRADSVTPGATGPRGEGSNDTEEPAEPGLPGNTVTQAPEPQQNQQGEEEKPPVTTQPGPPEETANENPTETKHEFASTQVNLTGPVADQVRAAGAAIPADELAEDGREAEPHITALYGLHADNPDQVRELLRDQPPITVTLEKASLFPAAEKETSRGGAGSSDVLKVDVDSPDLHRVNALLRQLPHTNDFPVYKPHVTIAYLKPGEGKKYDGNSIPGVTGQQVTLHSLVFSGKDGKQIEIPLTGKPAADTAQKGSIPPANVQPSAATSPEGGTTQASGTPTLPHELAGAKPRYGIGPKAWTLDFANDLDRAAYISAQPTPSKQDRQYVDFVSQHTGLTEAEVREHGNAIKATVKDLSRSAPAGTPARPKPLSVPAHEWPRPESTKGGKPESQNSGEPENPNAGGAGIARDNAGGVAEKSQSASDEPPAQITAKTRMKAAEWRDLFARSLSAIRAAAERDPHGEVSGDLNQHFLNLLRSANEVYTRQTAKLMRHSGVQNGTPAKIAEVANRFGAAVGMPAAPATANVETGPHGPIFRQFHHDAQGAVAKLLAEKTGEAIGALHHPAVGDIDLVWGDEKHGLAKIAQRHPEVLGDLQGLLDGLTESRRSDQTVFLEDPKHTALVRLNWEGAQKKWLLTAYSKEGGPSSAEGTIDVSGTHAAGRQAPPPGDASTTNIAPGEKGVNEEAGRGVTFTPYGPDAAGIRGFIARFTNPKGEVHQVALTEHGDTGTYMVTRVHEEQQTNWPSPGTHTEHRTLNLTTDFLPLDKAKRFAVNYLNPLDAGGIADYRPGDGVLPPVEMKDGSSGFYTGDIHGRKFYSDGALLLEGEAPGDKLPSSPRFDLTWSKALEGKHEHTYPLAFSIDRSEPNTVRYIWFDNGAVVDADLYDHVLKQFPDAIFTMSPRAAKAVAQPLVIISGDRSVGLLMPMKPGSATPPAEVKAILGDKAIEGEPEPAAKPKRVGPPKLPKKKVAPVTQNKSTIEAEQSHAELPGAEGSGTPEGTPAGDVSRPGEQGNPGESGETNVGGVHGQSSQPDRGEEASVRPGAGTGKAPRVPAGGSRPASPRRKSAGPDLSRDYVLTDADHIGEGSLREKAQANVDAVRILKQCEAEGRPATPEEQRKLAKFTGWGALSKVFESAYYVPAEYKPIRAALDELLTPDEFKAAAASTVNAHYTSPLIVAAMWDAMRHLGMDGGERVLEPSMGVGNFFGLMPDDLKKGSDRTGVELDSITGGIAKLLYPGSHVNVSGLEKTPLVNDFFDVAIGNVPFGNFGVNDPEFRDNRKVTRSIHNYFFAKALKKVREGGVVAFITSSFTMDSQDPAVRKYLSDNADLLGAIRLPNTAFKGNAGTEVTTDIIFLRKRAPGTPPAGEAWINQAEIQANQKRPDGSTGKVPIKVNEYFAKHPEMMLGQMTVERGMYNANTHTLAGKVTPENLAAAIAKLPADVMTRRGEQPEEPEVRIPLSDLPDPNVVKDGGFVVQAADGKPQLMIRDGQELKPAGLDDKKTLRVRDMLTVRDAWRNVLIKQEEGSEEEATRARRLLNTAYDSFVKANGPLSSRDNARAFAGDSDAPGLLSLEHYDAKTKKAKKADVFEKRTNVRYVPPETAEDAAAALAITLNEYGGLNWKRLQALTGLDRTELEDALVENKLIFQNPEGEKFETADQYLSGDVREKLRTAIAAAESDKRYEHNVEALKLVQPTDLGPGEIDARLGAGWIPNDVIAQFLSDNLKVTGARIGHAEAIASWTVQGGSNTGNAANTEEYGGYGWSGVDLVSEAMNLKAPTVRVEGPDKTSVVDPVATAALREKQQKLKDLFRKWVWEDAARAERLAHIYNERYNNLRLREFDGSHLQFPGMAAGIELRQHQKNAIWRMLQGGNTLLAHVVGAGKTYAMVAAAMEMRRLGTAQKPMFVVPNHLVQQWAAEFMRLYPNANLFVAGKDTFAKGNRQLAMSRIANGSYDAVIVSHVSYGKLPVKDDTYNAWLNGQIEELRNAIEDVSAAEGSKGPTVKDLQKAIKRLEEKLERRAKREKKDNAVNFEDLGIDQLFVDEAHAFKNLFFTTKMTRIAGLPNTESDRAIDMFLKTQWLTRKRAGAGVVFATGTPISNTMAEMYTMQRYLQMQHLKETGLAHFDAWAQQYGEGVTSLELAPDGSGYRMNTRFSRFVNLPELATAFRVTADVQTADMLKLPTPKLKSGKPIIVAAKASEPLKAYVAGLVKRAEAIKGKRVEKGADNMLKITGDGRKAALDMRLVHPGSIDNPEGKVSRAAEKVLDIWKRTADKKSTQLVFCDLSTPGPGFNVYDSIKDKLLAGGVPEHEIAFIHDYDTDARKKALFDAVNDGSVRILLGSTEKMGAGMNVQKKLIALHHLDAPWRPSDIEQREGRILRQGNENPEVEIYRYVTEGSFDAYMWQTLESKARFIAQVMRGDVSVRTAEDVEGTALTYAEIKGIASGNPKVVEKIKVDMEVRRLDGLRSEYLNRLHKMRMEVAATPSNTSFLEESKAASERDLARRNNAPDDLWRFGGQTFTGKDATANAGAKLQELLQKDRDAYQAIEDADNAVRAKYEAEWDAIKNDETLSDYKKKKLKGEIYERWDAEKKSLPQYQPVRLGTYKGFDLWTSEQHDWNFVDGRRIYGLSNVSIQGDKKYHGSTNQDGNPLGTLASIRYHLDTIEGDISGLENTIRTVTQKQRDLQALIDKPFEHEERLNQLLKEQEQLNKELDLNKNDTQTQGEEQKEQVIEKAKDPEEEDEEESAPSMDPASPRPRVVTHHRIPEVEPGAPIDRRKLGTSFWTEETGTLDAARVADVYTSARDDIRKNINPYALSPEADTAGLSLREHAARSAQSFARAEKALEEARKYFAARPWDENLDFINRVEDGAKQPNAKLQAIADDMRQMLDDHRTAVQNLGKNKLTQFYEYYFPHLWNRSGQAENVFKAIFGKRPIEGTKGFLKQRKFQSFQEGVDAGLVPVSENPVDLVLLKLKEMERYILAHRFLNEMKRLGLAKYVPAIGPKKKPPQGWVKIPDTIGTVWGPPFVQVPEAHDKEFMDTLLGLAQDLGLNVQRVATLRSAWGRAYKGKDLAKVKFAGPESVILHELGHLIDWRYNIGDTLKGHEFQAELRKLADLRLVGNDTPYFQKYIRRGEEKIANMVAAYGHMRDRFRRVAPKAYAWFSAFIQQHPELAPLKKLRYGMQLRVDKTEYPTGGFIQRGNYYMPPGAAQLVSNYLSPGLQYKPWYQVLRSSSNLMLQFALGFSGFHAGFTTMDAAVSKLAVSLQYLAAGKPIEAVRHGNPLAVAAAPISNVIRGSKIRDAYLSKAASVDPELAKYVEAIVQGGGRVTMDAQYRSGMMQAFTDAWRKGKTGSAALAAIPALAELAVWPVLEWLVPRQKLGVFADMVDFELKRMGPNATQEDRRRAFSGAWDSVDNRMGQLVYDNLFWNRTVKDLMMLSVQSVGWNLGTLREFGGAAGDVAGMAGAGIRKIRGGGPPGPGGPTGGSGSGRLGGGSSSPRPPSPQTPSTRRMAYAIALLLLTGTIGAITNYVNTKGRRRPDGSIDSGIPDGWRDLFFPRTGNVDEAGRDERMALPGYLKDLVAWYMEPTSSARNKLSPIVRVIAETLSNRNFYNERIWDGESNALPENVLSELRHIGSFFVPMSVSGMLRERDRGTGAGMQAGQFLGVRTAPSYITRSAAENLMAQYADENRSSGPRDTSARATAKRDIATAIRSGNLQKAITLGEAAIKGGAITDKDFDALLNQGTTGAAPLAAQFQKMENLHQAIHVFGAADPKEKAELLPILDKKLSALDKMPPQELQRALRELKAAGALD